MPDLNAEIDTFVATFVKQVTDAACRTAIDTLTKAMKDESVTSTRPRPPAATRQRRRSANAAPAAELAPQLLAHLRGSPGQRMEQVRDALGVPTERLRAAVQGLVADGLVRFEGVARGRRYFPAAGKVAATRRKGARRK